MTTASSTKRIIAVIPARYGSRRLLAKPLVEIAGKPMIQHVYERTAKAQCLNATLVATDDDRIAAVVRSFGGHAIISPDNLQSGTDRVAFVARTIPGVDIIVNVQGDEPLLCPEMIDEVVLPLLENDSVVVGTLVRRVTNNDDLEDPNVPKVVLDRDGDCLYFSRSAIPFVRDQAREQWLTRCSFFKHIGIYAFRRHFLLRFAEMSPTPLEQTEKLEQLRILEHGYKIRASITHYDSTPVDTEKDLQKVRALLRNP
jgi:3-deoxy-manno-octulosonate cytidylyltransferase (CMP-KDO synthetase)